MKQGYIYNDWVFKPTGTYPIDPHTSSFSNGVIPVNLVSYELPYETSQGITGQVVIAGDLKRDYSNHIIRIDDKLYHIKQSSSVAGGNTTLQIGDDASILDDSFMFTLKNAGQSGHAGFLLSAAFPFTRGQRANHPYMYGRPKMFYASVSDPIAAALATFVPDLETLRFDNLDDMGNYIPISVAKLLRYIRMQGFDIAYTVDNQYMNAYCDYKSVYEKETPIFDKDGHSDIISANFANEVSSYVVVSGQNGIRFEYANIDGVPVQIPSIYTQEPLEIINPNRYGYTSIVQDNTLTSMDDALLLAKEEIGKNKYNHKIVFESDKELHIGQPVVVCLDRGNYHSVISSVVKKSNTDRLQYTCGDLPVTASDLIRDNAWSYNGIPKNPRKGQLIFV